MSTEEVEHSSPYSQLAPITPEIRRRVRRADPTMTVSAGLSMAEAPPGVEIESVVPGGLADRAGLTAGETVLTINGEPIRDTIDYYFHGSDEELQVEVRNREGALRTLTIEKENPEQDLGLELKQFTTQNCGCNCVFCFVHQLPDNMRKSLYVKDEDYRLSFLQGSYITGVTLKPADLERIARQRLSPLYISVHAIDEELRRWLLGIKKAPAILEVLGFFKKHRIQVHTQIVLCPHHNDGKQLDRTLDTLLGFHPTVQSIAIVPLGMTKWREGLPELPPVTPAYARGFIRSLEPRLRSLADKHGEPIVLLADEWYLIAGRKAPSYSRWPDLPQLENGVGMVYHFYKDFNQARKLLSQVPPPSRPWRVGAVTSTLSGPVLEKITALLAETGHAEVTLLPTVNRVFGETIHVTGLLTGQDILRTIQSNPGFDQYLLPGNCIRKTDHRFLDDMLYEDLQEKTGQRINAVLGGALDFAETVLEASVGWKHAPVKEHAFLAKHWANS
jgi:putative radical SAM enzyme (TIGR03279 family)